MGAQSPAGKKDYRADVVRCYLPREEKGPCGPATAKEGRKRRGEGPRSSAAPQPAAPPANTLPGVPARAAPGRGAGPTTRPAPGPGATPKPPGRPPDSAARRAARGVSDCVAAGERAEIIEGARGEISAEFAEYVLPETDTRHGIRITNTRNTRRNNKEKITYIIRHSAAVAATHRAAVYDITVNGMAPGPVSASPTPRANPAKTKIAWPGSTTRNTAAGGCLEWWRAWNRCRIPTRRKVTRLLRGARKRRGARTRTAREGSQRRQQNRPPRRGREGAPPPPPDKQGGEGDRAEEEKKRRQGKAGRKGTPPGGGQGQGRNQKSGGGYEDRAALLLKWAAPPWAPHGRTIAKDTEIGSHTKNKIGEPES